MDEMQTIAKGELSACRLCPRACGVDRLAGGRDVCRAGALPKVFRWGALFGERPPGAGTYGRANPAEKDKRFLYALAA